MPARRRRARGVLAPPALGGVRLDDAPAGARRRTLPALDTPAVVRGEVVRRGRRGGTGSGRRRPAAREVVGRVGRIERRGRRDHRASWQVRRVRAARRRRRLGRVPLPPLDGAVRVHLLAHARQEGARESRRARLGHALVRVIHLERDLVQLRDGVAAHLARRAEQIRDALRALLQAAADDRRRVVDLADDQHGRDDARREALQDHGLVVVDRDLGPVVREGDGVRRGRGVIWLRRGRGWGVDAAGWLVHVDDVHDKRVPARCSRDERRRGRARALVDAHKRGAIGALERRPRPRYTQVLGRHGLGAQTVEERNRRAVIDAH